MSREELFEIVSQIFLYFLVIGTIPDPKDWNQDHILSSTEISSEKLKEFIGQFCEPALQATPEEIEEEVNKGLEMWQQLANQERNT